MAAPVVDSTVPIATPPVGMASNFTNPPSLKKTIVIVSATMIILSFFFVSIRLISNSKSPRKLGWDDGCCVLAFVLTTAYVGDMLSYTIGKHTWDVPLTALTPTYVKKVYIEGMLIGPSMYFAKLAVLLLYLKLFAPKKTIRYLIYFGMAFIFCAYWINVPLQSLYCAPRAGQAWDASILPNCNKLTILGVAQGVCGVSSDLYILFLPVPVVLSLNLPLERRLGVLAIFMVGIIALLASIIALYYRVKLFQGRDPVWDATLTFIFINIEIYSAIICSSMPACSAFFKSSLVGARLFTSLRSYFFSIKDRSKFSSTRFNTFSTPPHSSKPHIAVKDHPFIEMEDGKMKISLLNHQGAVGSHAVDTNGIFHHGGITKSITVEQTTK